MIEEDFGLNDKYDNLSEVLFGNILRTADAIHHSLEAFLAPSDVSLAQYNVLRSIRERGANGAEIGLLATEMINRQPDMTRLIDRMVQKGLVARYDDPKDRRKALVRLTTKGLKIANVHELPLVKLHDENFAVLSRAEKKQLKGLLFKVRSQMLEKEKNKNAKGKNVFRNDTAVKRRRLQFKGE
jgi:DNA-binding MarR family transcriptional regulator